MEPIANQAEFTSTFHMHRSKMIRWMGVATLLSISLWLGIYKYQAPIVGMDDAFARIIFSGKCLCLAVLFCLVTGIEAVAHERLQSPAFDPLLGYETRRLKINLRYLQNTLEQLIVFAVGTFGLAYYCSNGAEMRAVVATTVIWILSRFGFWIGYHFGAQYRGFGMPGVGQSMIVLIYVCCKVGFEAAGYSGATALLAIFLGIEAYLFFCTRPPRSDLPSV